LRKQFYEGKFSLLDKYWTSENKEIDGLIRYTQLNTTQARDYLEWIPFEAFEMVKYIGSGGFSSIYLALWMEGPRWKWDNRLEEWTQTSPIKVVLKRLDNSLNISSSYVDQVIMFILNDFFYQILHSKTFLKSLLSEL